MSQEKNTYHVHLLAEALKSATGINRSDKGCVLPKVGIDTRLEHALLNTDLLQSDGRISEENIKEILPEVLPGSKVDIEDITTQVIKRCEFIKNSTVDESQSWQIREALRREFAQTSVVGKA